jgi:hypothetical protein
MAASASARIAESCKINTSLDRLCLAASLHRDFYDGLHRQRVTHHRGTESTRKDHSKNLSDLSASVVNSYLALVAKAGVGKRFKTVTIVPDSDTILHT